MLFFCHLAWDRKTILAIMENSLSYLELPGLIIYNRELRESRVYFPNDISLWEISYLDHVEHSPTEDKGYRFDGCGMSM